MTSAIKALRTIINLLWSWPIVFATTRSTRSGRWRHPVLFGWGLECCYCRFLRVSLLMSRSNEWVIVCLIYHWDLYSCLGTFKGIATYICRTQKEDIRQLVRKGKWIWSKTAANSLAMGELWKNTGNNYIIECYLAKMTIRIKFIFLWYHHILT